MKKEPKVHWSKKVRSVPYNLPIDGAVHIRPVSFKMDKLIDTYVITGGGVPPMNIADKSLAMEVAEARARVMARKARLRRNRSRQQKRAKNALNRSILR